MSSSEINILILRTWLLSNWQFYCDAHWKPKTKRESFIMLDEYIETSDIIENALRWGIIYSATVQLRRKGEM